MANNVKSKSIDKNSNDNSIQATINKALKSNSVWPDKDEFLDVVYWLRQIIGLFLGVFWGVMPLRGFIGIVVFLLLNIAIIYFYSNSFQRVDEEEFGGVSEIIKEGLMTSFATFVVTWIIVYSALHHP